jgi:acetyltransferase-like isoleucine patch superfamily enzyme
MYTLIRGTSEVLHLIAIKARLLYYNLTCFIFTGALPWSTVIYGGLRIFHRPCNLRMGSGGRLGAGTYLATSRGAVIDCGDNVQINLGCVLVAMQGIRIGAGCSLAEYVSIRDQAHRHAEGHGIRGQGFDIAPIEIGRNVWIGRGAYIGAGAKIGDGCIIGANSVVHGEFPPNMLIVGAPARAKRPLYPADATELTA